ncbi:MAG: aminotransferase class I/II-fold pyridoxal phosphate-dependent enzyme [Candidatus Peribacteraceae bacterium]|nr:aminotransferase class I/II-fold pyridoxal phosphate-dependent enzyme [Candidatus Peribacteraceae bacterium]
MILRPIHHTFAPLADGRFCARALMLLLQPWTWRRGPAVQEFRNALRENFAHLSGDSGVSADVFLFSSGREGLMALLQSMNIGHGDEIIVQAYTCVVVPNAIIAAGATPIFVDIVKETLSLDPQEVRKAITPKTKAIICQHTFGIPAPLEELRAICDEHRIPLIEDCAHVIPDDEGPSEIGKTGEFVLLSFGRDKAISGVTGGAILSRRTDVSNRLKRLEDGARDLSLLSIKRFLLYPLIYALARPFYGLWIGKAFLKLCSLLRILPSIVTSEEKSGHQSPALNRLPNACAALALDQLKRLRQINDHRRMLTRFYLEQCAEHGWPVLHGIRSDLPLQKFPMFLEGAEKIRQSLKKKNIHLHDGWTGCVICPESVDPASLGYRDGDDPRAEEVCEQILCLPTHPNMRFSDGSTLIRIFTQQN